LSNPTRDFLGDEPLWTAVRIELYDVQGLWGGRRIRVDGHRNAVVEVVARTMLARRYEFQVEEDLLARLLEVMVEQDFVTIRPPERPGIPDEARPSITLVSPSGKAVTVAKWAGVREPRFAAAYRALLEIEALTAGLEPVSEARFARE